MTRYYLISIMLFSALTGCATKNIRIPMTRPAAIAVSPEVKSIAIVNRSALSNKFLNTIEEVISGEDLVADKEGAEAVIQALFTGLRNSPRFKIERTAESIKKDNLLNTLPEPLKWKKVKQLAGKYKVDGILALEVFDSDFLITQKEKREDTTGEKTRVIWKVEGEVRVTAGYRLYFPKKMNIEDEFTESRNMKWSAEGETAADALKALIDRKNAVIEAGRNSGSLYSGRIVPLDVYISRPIYVKPKDNGPFETGVRKMETGDWSGALELMRKAVKNSERKTAGRAAYNTAVIYEVLGKLDKARDWAEKAYVKYEEDRAKDLIAAIDYRKKQEAELTRQLTP